jgi:ketosteroid isomerase-like protein
VSQENVEIVVACSRAYFAGDLDGCLARCARDIEVFPDVAVFPEAGPLRGREELRPWLEDAATAWASMEMEVREVLTLPDGRIVLRQEWGGVGAASGARTLADMTGIWTVDSGLVSRIEYHFDRAEALKAVGLEA